MGVGFYLFLSYFGAILTFNLPTISTTSLLPNQKNARLLLPQNLESTSPRNAVMDQPATEPARRSICIIISESEVMGFPTKPQN